MPRSPAMLKMWNQPEVRVSGLRANQWKLEFKKKKHVKRAVNMTIVKLVISSLKLSPILIFARPCWWWVSRSRSPSIFRCFQKGQNPGGIKMCHHRIWKLTIQIPIFQKEVTYSYTNSAQLFWAKLPNFFQNFLKFEPILTQIWEIFEKSTHSHTKFCIF